MIILNAAIIPKQIAVVTDNTPAFIQAVGFEDYYNAPEMTCIVNGVRWDYDEDKTAFTHDGLLCGVSADDSDYVFYYGKLVDGDFVLIPGSYEILITRTIEVDSVKLKAKQCFTAYGEFGEIYSPGYNQVFECEESFASHLTEGGQAEPYNLIEPEGTIQITENGTGLDVGQYALADVAVPASAVDTGKKSITENGTDIDVVGYAAVDVSVPSSPETPTSTIKLVNETGLRLNLSCNERKQAKVNDEWVMFWTGGRIVAEEQHPTLTLSKYVAANQSVGMPRFLAYIATSQVLPAGKRLTAALSGGVGNFEIFSGQNEAGYVAKVMISYDCRDLDTDPTITFSLLDE